MQYDVKSPEEYIENLTEDWRKEKLLLVREMILSYSSLKEGVNYKMLSYGNDDDILFHLNAQANYVSLYVGNIDKIDTGRELLEKLDLGKGCIRIKKTVNISSTGLDKFIEMAVGQWQSGDDLEC